MENGTSALTFVSELLDDIGKNDQLHSKRIEANIQYAKQNFPDQFDELTGLVCAYYNRLNLPAQKIAADYLRMINDLRIYGLYFYRNGKYRCSNQKMAYETVYSKTEVMSYYMNALLASQILWKNHFSVYLYFQSKLPVFFSKNGGVKVLDVGPGHGFFSYLVKKNLPAYQKMDLVDISETSLSMTKSILGYDKDKIGYFNRDIFSFDETDKYDFIVLGEVLEHLDAPQEILLKLRRLLSDSGVLWLTTPTNSPAIDHVYLFRNRQEILALVESAGLDILDSRSFLAEDVEEEEANKQRITNLVGVFCKKRTN